MNLKATLISLALLGLASAASAAPSLQTCSPMEVVHNGTNGLSYTLACEAGGWKLNYSGSVPTGSSDVVAKYRLAVTGGRGEAFTHTRSVRLPTPNLLGQVLLREAVLLDNGDIALRECEPIGCTQYRPLGSKQAGLTEATITGSQEIVRLKAEVLRLGELSEARLAELTQAKADLEARQGQVATLQADLVRLSGEIDQVKAKATTERQTLEALLTEARAQRTAALEAEKQAVQAAAAAAPAPAAPQKAEPAAVAAVQVLPLDSRFSESMDQLKELTAKYQSLKLTHEDTLAKLDRAQNEAAMAAARLEATALTQQLMAQNLAIAHAELDSTKHELATLKRERATADVSDALKAKDALMGRITSALVNANTQLNQLKAELAAAKGSPSHTPKK